MDAAHSDREKSPDKNVFGFQMMNDEQNSKDDDDFLDYEEDDPVMEDNYNLDEENEEEERREEADESTARSPLTNYKWQHYGTRSRVEESRRNQLRLPQDNYGKKYA